MGWKLEHEKQGKGNSPKITIRLTDMQFKRLNNIARKQYKNRSEVIRTAIDSYLLNRKKLD